MSKEKNEDITDDIHSESETDELEESNEVSDEERIELPKIYKFECRSCGNTNLKRVV